MSSTNNIVERAGEYVTAFFHEKMPAWALYHSLEHTQEVVEACREIAEHSNLSKEDTEVATLAAWFHDAGYAYGVDGHEAKGAELAREFLMKNGYPEAKIDSVAGCIMATRIPQQPSSLIEKVVCDADIFHAGTKRFFRKNELMRSELELREGRLLADTEWLARSVDFVVKNSFHTEYTRSEYGPKRLKNLLALQDLLRGAESAAAKDGQKKEKTAQKLEKEKRPERGIETMFRVVPKNHLDLSSLADQKANIMISTNAIIMSIVFGLLVSKLDTNPHLIPPTFILMAVCLTAMIFAILATRPHVTSGTFTREDIQKKRANLLFFGNFHNSSLDDFTWGMQEMMRDREYLYDSMIRDLYYLGKVLGVKYRYLRICYNVFMYGLIAAVAAFVIAMLTAPPIQ